MATALLWRPAPVMTLTIRQFLGGKAVRIVTALSFIPCLFALFYVLVADADQPRSFLTDAIVLNMMTPTVIPIAVLILATGALGHEVEDRTLPYLVLKPMSRLRIAVEKLLGVVVVALPIVLLGLVATYLVVALGADDQGGFVSRRAAERTDIEPVLPAMLGAATVAVISTAAVFLFISLIIPRALLVGIFYAFAWESLLGKYLPGIKTISLRHYADSTFVALMDAGDVTIDGSFSLRTSLITVAITVAIALLLTTWRLRRMNLE